MSDSEADQATIRVVMQRGGTSRGLYFHERDMPPPSPRRDKLLLRLMGSPDVVQIDGLGGSRPITSTIAILSRSTRGDADVDYTFGQVEIDRDVVVYSAKCGNISSGVGPFAVDEGMVTAKEGLTQVRIYNTNTKATIIADVPVRNVVEEIDGNRKLLDLAQGGPRQGGGAVRFPEGLAAGRAAIAGDAHDRVRLPPKAYNTWNGAEVRAEDTDLRVRLLFMNRLHESIAGTGSICLAAASRISGSTVEEVSCNRAGDVLLIGHPSGVTPTKVKADPTNEPPFVKFEVLGFSRTSRRLMDCTAYYPTHTLDGVDEHAGAGQAEASPGVVYEE